MIYQRKQAPKLSTKLICIIGLPALTAAAYWAGWLIYAAQHGY